MCGIAGALIYDPRVARLDCLLAAVEASAARGEDSFGVVRWSPSTGFRHHGWPGRKRDRWLDTVGAPAPDEETIYLHTSRAEPTTEWQRIKTDRDIPPFVADGIAVAHNGIVANIEELASTYRLSPKSRIDTAAVPSLVARLGVWRTIANLKGGAALAIFDSASTHLVLCRNFMPLVTIWEPGIICFASEAAFFPGAGQPFPQFQLWELPPYTGIELSAQGFRGPFPWGKLPKSASDEHWRAYPSLRWSH
jgi:glucosamine 6-phosphate synthetase-like amidotransferase/phosphosugar isomerase protein